MFLPPDRTGIPARVPDQQLSSTRTELHALVACSSRMKVIFLDIDGVLNCKKTRNPRKFPYVVDPKLLRRFKGLLERTGAKVVLSSTWRYDPAGLFSARHAGIPFMDVTPDMPKRPRRDEVLAWLKQHPRVKRYAIIDDEDDELDELPLFQPPAATGLTPGIVTGVANYLNGKTDRDMRLSAVVRVLQNVQAALKSHQG
jgi:Swiss Army Knife RNA repair-like protein